MALLSWLGARQIKRIDDLEEKVVSKGELRDALEELRDERRNNHEENRQKLDRLIEKIDENEKRAAHTRHETLDSVHQLALKVAVLTRKES